MAAERGEMRRTRRGGAGSAAATAPRYPSAPAYRGCVVDEAAADMALEPGAGAPAPPVPPARSPGEEPVAPPPDPPPTVPGAELTAPEAVATEAGPAAPVLVDIDPWSYVAFAGVALVAVALFAIGSAASDVLTGIGVGVLVGVALSPVVSAVERRWHTTRGSAVVLVGTGLAIGSAAVVLLVAPAAIRQARDFSDELPQTVEKFYTWPVVGQRLQDADASTKVEDWINSAPARVDDRTLADAGERLLGGVLSTVIVLVTALGVMVDGEVVVRRMRALVPPSDRLRTTRVAGIVYATFGSYFAGSLFVAVLAGLVILSAGLALGIPLAPVAGLWTTLTNLIPQIGGFLGGGFFVLLALTKGPVQAVIALGIFLGYQQLENHVIQPAIVGRAVNLSPPATMMAALVGAAAAGIPGALVATPLLGAVKAIYLDSRGEAPENETERIRSRLSGFVRRHTRPAGNGDGGGRGG
jgi:putative heme transporter